MTNATGIPAIDSAEPDDERSTAKLPCLDSPEMPKDSFCFWTRPAAQKDWRAPSTLQTKGIGQVMPREITSKGQRHSAA